MIAWAVDPGEKHVGIAEFEFVATGTEIGEDWACLRAWETDPEDGVDRIAAALLNYQIETLIVEEFRLYPDKAMAQTGSTMPTCEMIGQIKWAHRLDSRRRREQVAVYAAQAAALGGRAVKARQSIDLEIERNAAVDLVLQPASIQTPTAGLLRRRGITSVAKRSRGEIVAAGGTGEHALSAELHGWHWILRPGSEQ